ncbi:MAG: DNA polymerase III subunit gamma/tau C-terminal domain-containing protein, partial [Psychromonas sp.]
AVQLLAERLSPEEVQLYYQIALQGYKDFAFAPDGKIALEMTVMRLLAFKPANYISLDEQQLGKVASLDLQSPPQSTAKCGADQVTTATGNSSQETQPRAEAQPSAKAQTTEAEQSLALSEQQSPAPAIKSVVQETDEQPIAQQTVQPEPQKQQGPTDDTNDPLAQVTHSRNMLRSHRLKREAEKKSQATTVNQTATVVADKLPEQGSLPAKSHVTEPDLSLKTTQHSSVDDLHEGLESGNTGGHNNTTTHTTSNAATRATANDHDFLSTSENDTGYPEQIPIEAYQDDGFAADDDYREQPEAFSSEPFTADFKDNNSVENSSQNSQDQRVTATAVQQLPEQQREFSADNSFVDEVIEQTEEIDPAKYVADKLTDPWAIAIQKMQLVGLVKLLAKNSVMQLTEQQILLTLKPEQQHLLNNHQLCSQLEAQLKAYYGEQLSMYIEVGQVSGKLTALESELAIYQRYLNNAKLAIKEDQNILTFVSEYGAKIYENSIIPL